MCSGHCVPSAFTWMMKPYARPSSGWVRYGSDLRSAHDDEPPPVQHWEGLDDNALFMPSGTCFALAVPSGTSGSLPCTECPLLSLIFTWGSTLRIRLSIDRFEVDRKQIAVLLT